MKVADIMTPEIQVCAPNDDLDTAARIMWEQNCGAVPVTDDAGRVVGIVTDRDICRTAYLRGESLACCSVRSAMSTNVVACDADDHIDAAQALMRRHQVRRLPVLDLHGRLVGILSLTDLVVAAEPGHARGDLESDGVWATLIGISQHRSAAEHGGYRAR